MSWTMERKKSHLVWNQVPSQQEQHLVIGGKTIRSMTTAIHWSCLNTDYLLLIIQSGSGIVGVVIYECLSIPGRVRLHFHAQLRAARLRSGRGGCLWLGVPRSAAVREGQRLRLVAWGKETWEERPGAMRNRHKELDGRRIKITVCTQFANIEKYPNLVQKNTLESISVVKSQLKYCYLTYQTKIWSKYIFTIVWDLGRGVAGILRSTDVSGTKKLFQCIRSDWKGSIVPHGGGLVPLNS